MTRSDLHRPEGFAAFMTGLPAVTLHAQWDAQVAKVAGKVFCLLGDQPDGGAGPIVFKVNEIAFDGLTELEGIEQAAYFAKRQWVRVAPGALNPDLLEGYIRQSHALVMARLTKKLRSELGL
jgi:predicted DNA-binding protein (MmcQ/YjbR family)